MPSRSALRRASLSTIVDEGAALPTARQSATVHKSVVVIGGGQAGLSVGYHLKREGVSDFVILDASPRIGDAWRNRWDSLKLFSPAQYDGLSGMPFPAARDAIPTKDEMADYLVAYAERFALPVVSATRVDTLGGAGGRFGIRAGDRHWSADQVVVAMGDYQVPTRPAFAGDLDRGIRQLHAFDYRSPAQLAPGDVLLVGSGNSGAELANDIAATHSVILAGTNIETPGSFDDFVTRRIVLPLLHRLIFPYILSVYTPIGRRLRPKLLKAAAPLIRVKSRQLRRLGVRRVTRITAIKDGLPQLEDGTSLQVSNVIWCTGYRGGFSWIKLPVVDADHEPLHERGIAIGQSGLYFVGLHFLTSMASETIGGVGRDARRIATLVAKAKQAASAR